MPKLHIHLMGSPQIIVDGAPVALERRKALALVAYLCITGKPASRDSLAAMLWEDYDDERARASLRRTLTVINKTELATSMEIDRQTLALRQDSSIWVDATRLSELLNHGETVEDMREALELYHDGFMTGFTLKDSTSFDDWQSLQAQTFQQKLLIKLEEFTQRLISTGAPESAVDFVQRWLSIDPLHETANYLLLRLYGDMGQRTAALRHFEGYQTLLTTELGISPDDETLALYQAIKSNSALTRSDPRGAVFGNLPPVPALVIGRDDARQEIKRRLGGSTTQSPVVIQGWPGIGKTTLMSVIAHDPDIHERFPDGVLWTSLGENPNVLTELITWGRALNSDTIHKVNSIDEASSHLTRLLRDKHMLLIVDDAWEVGHALPFRVGGQGCAMLITTRMNDVSQQIAPQPEAIYKLPILTDESALDLLRTLAPEVVEGKPVASRELVLDLEGLPLAIQVAGRLLHTEHIMGWDITNLLAELREGARLLEADAPADRMDLVQETTPTIAVLLQRSTDLLGEDDRERFALLGVFAPKPATFDQDAIAAVWAIDNVRPTVRKLVDRGLLEPVGHGRFQMHALLVMHAKSMFAG